MPAIIILNSGLLIWWMRNDLRMPASWFVFAQRYPSAAYYAESYRYKLMSRKWRIAAERLDLTGKWRCDDGADGSFTCEFTADGIFRIKADDINSRWGVIAKSIDGLPYFRDPTGYGIPAGRTGGRFPTGISYGMSFLLQEGPVDHYTYHYTYGYVATDGKSVEVTLDSTNLSIVYQNMIWERIE